MTTIRVASLEDADAIKNIYNYYVENSAITFDEALWDIDDAIHKIEVIISGGYPFWVCYEDEELVGYCYLSSWNYRDAYRTTAENTLYIAPEQKGKGYGSLLLNHLIDNSDRDKLHTIIACITIPNDASIYLHEKLGFVQVSTLKEVGFKLNQWQTVGHWQLLLK